METCVYCGKDATFEIAVIDENGVEIDKMTANCINGPKDDRVICKECIEKIYPTPKVIPKPPKSNHILYRKSFWDRRVGVCNFCRAIVKQIDAQTDKFCKTTHLHHVEYDTQNPLKHTIELCPSCHYKEPKKPGLSAAIPAVTLPRAV